MDLTHKPDNVTISAGITSKLGFSVVAPNQSVIQPFSTAAKSESCCDLLKR